ncbi:MAG: hypothetical protein A2Y67_03000 [Candidatus Buchananbacteria bacterium RBG_13_39_9]|uniref:Uncharacterized protein n=1 Tax=Candidatus Buchananbacteria bacterium RBG_13_39_9 TaxID=1797531 RepID=A0A1G1XPP8_9BACT|nr:MAG: hypothetical protein A2Y67_03000 [Candidatus Buchananbacteria bacterium RBG_13_39_9]
MREQRKIKTPEEVNYELFRSNYLGVLKDPNVPDIFKILLRHNDLLLVLGKLKPITEIEINKEIVEEWEKAGYWDEGDLDKFKIFLRDKFKLSIGDESRDGKGAFLRVFDVEQIKEQIKKFPDLLSWDDKKNDLRAWWEENLQSGKKWDYILGICEGFPKSAIEYWLRMKGLKDEKRQMLYTYDENYGVPPGELAPDVADREQQKKMFFDQFNNDQEIQAELKNTEDLKKELLQIRQRVTRELFEKDERLKK